MLDLVPLFVLIPLGAAFACLLVKKRAPAVAPWLSLVSVVALLGLAIAGVVQGTSGAAIAGGWSLETHLGTSFLPGIVLVFDGLSAMFLLLVAVVSTAVLLFGLRYMDTYDGRPLYYALLSLLIAGMNGAVLAGDLFNLYVFIEIASIASYALVAFGTGGREIEAAFKYLMLGAVASSSILLGIAVLYASTGLLNMADLGAAIAAGQVSEATLLAVATLFLAGLGLKAAMMPFHAWLPDAHPSAPAPISAMLSGLLIKTLGIYALVRVLYVVIGMDGVLGGSLQTLLLVLGCLSMVGGVLLALGQTDLKRLLAYSSISQMGFVLVALGTNTWLGVAAGIYHALNHALFKSALFLSAGSLERLTGTRDITEMGGIARVAPATTLGTVGASLSIAGVPPFNGFWSKLLILIALFSAGLPVVGAIAAATAVLTLVTFVKVQHKALFGALPERLKDIKDVPASMSLPVVALALLCLLGGLLWPLGLQDIVGDAAASVRTDAKTNLAPEQYRTMVHSEGRQP
ncbi:MAG: proton-conducting transporter membrane subunit [Planctomycetota bacterium]|nr:proton-conducting transporter membrane subunit [Planctomycetota bacterium]